MTEDISCPKCGFPIPVKPNALGYWWCQRCKYSWPAKRRPKMTFEEWGEMPGVFGQAAFMLDDWKAERVIMLQERAQLAEGLLKAEQKMFKLIDAAKAFQELNACYRVGKRPSKKLFERLEKAHALLEEVQTKEGE
jgi:hypothetical protein